MSLYEHLAAMSEEKRLNMLETMPSILADAKQTDRLHTLLTTYDFMQAKVDVIGVEQLIDDYESTTSIEARLIQETLKACAHILLQEKGEFLAQLSGRIQETTVRSRLFTSSSLWSHCFFLPIPTLALNEEALIRTFTGHTSVVTKVVAGSNETFWSSSWDGTVIEWNINRNQALTVFTHPRKVISIAISPDGRYVISGDDEGYLFVWDYTTKVLVTSIQAHEGYIQDIKFANEPHHLITGSFDHTAIIWRFFQGQLIQYMQLKGHDNGVNAVVLDHKKAIAITGSWDNSILVYKLKTEHSFRLTDHRSGVRDVYYDSEHNSLISASNDRTVRIWSIDSGLELVRLILPDETSTKLTSVVRIPSRNLIVAGGENGHLYFWETDRYKFLGELATGSILISSLSILNSRYLLTASEGQAIRTYDIMRIQPGKPFSHKHYVSSVCVISSDRAVSMSATLFGGELHYWDMKTRTVLLSISNPPPLTFHSKQFIDASGASQVVLCSNTGLYLWQEGTSSISQLSSIGQNWVSDVEFLPQRKTLLICHDRALVFIDTNNYTSILEIPLNENIFLGQVAVSIDERYAAHVALGNGLITIYDANTGQTMWIKQHTDALNIEFAQENRLITLSENEIRLWSLDQETPLITRPIHRPPSDYSEGLGTFSEVAFDENRELLVVTLHDYHLRVFDTTTLELIATFTHRSRIHTCAIGSDVESRNKYYIVVGDEEGEVHFLQLYS